MAYVIQGRRPMDGRPVWWDGVHWTDSLLSAQSFSYFSAAEQACANVRSLWPLFNANVVEN